MAQLNLGGEKKMPSNRAKAGVRWLRKTNPKVDMTPMVDLGFLLITFFVITTELSKPTVMDLAMPKDGPPVDLAESGALTLITKGNAIYYYKGKWEEAVLKETIFSVQLSGKNSLRAVIGQLQILLDNNKNPEVGREDLMILIKPGPGTSYKTVVDLLDEATISMVKKYAIVKQTTEEMAWLQRLK
jgi:biopolymer transport protein ExbD